MARALIEHEQGRLEHWTPERAQRFWNELSRLQPWMAEKLRKENQERPTQAGSLRNTSEGRGR